jgi:amino-acid N-acetyltransferase
MRMSEAEIFYRSATTADWPAIADLLRACTLPLDGAEIHLSEFIVAVYAGRLVGCIGMERYGDAALLRSCAVAQDMRGQGIAQALVRQLLDLARAIGVREIALLTTTAERFFPRFGFVAVDRAALENTFDASEAFRGACPASAVAMRCVL